jgi:FixJ family two-component response regulator
VLDLRLPDMTGFEVLEKLRDFDKQTPVIVFTARSFIADQAVKYGANGFISKPFQPDELIKKIEQTLDHREKA